MGYNLVARRDGEYHHILHHRVLHETHKDSKALRRSLGMIALLDHDPHDALHRACPGVPPLDIYMAQRVGSLYVPHTDPLIGIDNYSFAVEKAMASPKSHEIERRMAALTIEAVRLQIPFIREGLIHERI